MKKRRSLRVVGKGGPAGDAEAPSVAISALLDQPNVWSDWQADLYIGPLSWVRMAALLVRSLSPEEVINALAPPLAGMRDELEAEIVRYAANPPDNVQHSVNLAGYRAFFEDKVPECFEAFMGRLDGGEDLIWLRERIARDSVWEQSFLWFFLNGIAHASLYGLLDLDKVNEEARWLVEIEFYEPARMAADQYVIRHFYGDLSERYDFAAPPPDEFRDHSKPIDPFSDWEDDWLTRRRAIDDRWERQLNRSHMPVAGELNWPADACLQAKWKNPWDRALDVARVPAFDWRRDVAVKLRDIPLGEVAIAVDKALLEMADVTARAVIERADERGRDRSEIRFGDWFLFWRENFRHGTDPLRAELNEFCITDDAAFVGDWLPRFEPAVFGDFLIRAVHGHVVERALGFRRKDEPKLMTVLFELNSHQPNRAMGLEDMTQHLWRRFADQYGVKTDSSELWCNFEVDWNVPMKQP